MLQLIETICYENGAFHRIPLHQERMNLARSYFFDCQEAIFLEEVLKIPDTLRDKKAKCRVSYSTTINLVEYEIFIPKQIQKLQCVYDDAIDYGYKLKNREALHQLLERTGTADEILIVKNGWITDASFANVVFLKEGEWYTPDTPLLRGTRRAEYLLNGILSMAQIRPTDLCQYEELRLINALLSIEESPSIPITSILL